MYSNYLEYTSSKKNKTNNIEHPSIKKAQVYEESSDEEYEVVCVNNDNIPSKNLLNLNNYGSNKTVNKSGKKSKSQSKCESGIESGSESESESGSESGSESESEEEDGFEFEISLDEDGDPNIDLTYNLDIRDSIIDYGEYITSKFLNKGHKILKKKGWCQTENRKRNNSITETLWDYKCLEGQFNSPSSENLILKKIKRVANLYRRGLGWLFCIRLQKGKRWILHRYIKKFIHELSSKKLEDKLDKGMTLSDVRKLKKKLKKNEYLLVNKIINRCIYIPRNASRYETKIEPFERVEEIINEEVGSYLDLEDKFIGDSWNLTRKNIRNALIALFTSFGILEAVLTGAVII